MKAYEGKTKLCTFRIDTHSTKNSSQNKFIFDSNSKSKPHNPQRISSVTSSNFYKFLHGNEPNSRMNLNHSKDQKMKNPQSYSSHQNILKFSVSPHNHSKYNLNLSKNHPLMFKNKKKSEIIIDKSLHHNDNSISSTFLIDSLKKKHEPISHTNSKSNNIDNKAFQNAISRSKNQLKIDFFTTPDMNNIVGINSATSNYMN